MTKRLPLMFLLGLVAAAGYGARDLWPNREGTGVAESEPTAPVPTGPVAPEGGIGSSSDPQAMPEMPTSEVAEQANVARLEDSGGHLIDMDHPLESQSNQLGENPASVERRPSLEPDYEAFLEELDAREDAEDAAELEPEKPARLTESELEALDEEELRQEAETYAADMADLNEEIKWRLWEAGEYDFEPSEDELRAE